MAGQEKYFAYDKPIVIPAHIKKMSLKELDAEIERLETEALREKLALVRGDISQKQVIRSKYTIPDDIKQMTREELDAEFERIKQGDRESLGWAV